MKKLGQNKGITLIALIITIIVMLILVGVTINIALNGGLFEKAKKVSYQTNASQIKEQLTIAKAAKLAENNGEILSDYGITLNDLQISDELKAEYGEKLVISKDANLYYDNSKVTGTEEQNWLKEIGITEYSGIDDDDDNGDVKDELYHEGIIPIGGVYTSVDGTVYNAGQNFPETVQVGDSYTFNDYEYRYNQIYHLSGWKDNSQIAALVNYSFSNGWGVRVLDNTKSEYGEIVTSINNNEVTNMAFTFFGCTNPELSTVPNIPSSVTNIWYTYAGTSITEAPVIPNNVTNMLATFASCTELTGEIEINANPTMVDQCFYGTEKMITLTGSASDATKAALAGTASNNNVDY